MVISVNGILSNRKYPAKFLCPRAGAMNATRDALLPN